jgi:hypothetical protein
MAKNYVVLLVEMDRHYSAPTLHPRANGFEFTSLSLLGSMKLNDITISYSKTITSR